MDKYKEISKEPYKVAIDNMVGFGDDVVFQINWNGYARKRGLIKIIMGDKEAVIQRDHLFSILFMLGSEEEQDRIISPFMKQTIVEKFTKMIGITAQKDVKKGEFLNVLLEFTYNPETKKIIIGKGSNHGLVKGAIRG